MGVVVSVKMCPEEYGDVEGQIAVESTESANGEVEYDEGMRDEGSMGGITARR